MMSTSDKPRSRSSQYMAAERAAFFARLDRGGTIREVAAELGFSVDSCYRWRQESGQSTRRKPERIYSAQDKAESFRLLTIHGNVSAVAKMLGFVRVTCYKWAHQAGIFTGRDLKAQRAKFLLLRSEGMSRADAARQLGVDKRTAQDWDKGAYQVNGGRVLADGTLVRYNSKMKQSSVRNPRQHYSRQPSLSPKLLEQVIDGRFLSLVEREMIHDLQLCGSSMRAIAATLHRSPSTISREVHRNHQPQIGYLPYAAHRAAAVRRSRPKKRKLRPETPLHDYVAAGLAQEWSPEQVSHRLQKDFPELEALRVSHETIYQALYDRDSELHRAASAKLRRGHTRRHSHNKPEQRTQRFTTPMANISHRPSEAQSRTVPGHWEGDLITGTLNQSAIGTLVERSSRYLMLVHLAHDHTAQSVREGLVKTLSGLPQQLRCSLTWDQGAEMSEHGLVSASTGMEVYFCDPGSPWQRGSNENTNGLLRQYFPKGSNLSTHTAQDLARVAQQLNNRPRKSLNWDTPQERIHDLLTTPPATGVAMIP